MEEVIKYLELKIDDLEVSIDNAKAYGSYATARKFVKNKIEFNAVIAFLKTCDGIKDITENGKLAIQRVSGCYWCDNPLVVGQALEVLPDNRGVAHEKCAEEFYGSKLAED